MSAKASSLEGPIGILNTAAITADSSEALSQQLVDRIPEDVRVVLIGEASHGTRDFYQQRADITKMLIQQRGFNAVAAEADFPDAFRANLYARGLSNDKNANEALTGFKARFPNWMWRNTTMLNFLEWLKGYNKQWEGEQQQAERGAGFYGLDVYSLHGSAAEVVAFLEPRDSEAAKRAKARYRCFDRYGDSTSAYAMAVGLGNAPPCAQPALEVLVEMLKREQSYAKQYDGFKGSQYAFAASANARVVAGAEKYFANMYFGREDTWNIRDTHMLDTLKALDEHLSSEAGRPAKVVVWAHNSHLGDARATDMGKRRGELNLGQLAREAYGDQAYNIGFTTHTGTVAAADEWDAPVRYKKVRESLPGSYEELMHKTGLPHFALDLRGGSEELKQATAGPKLERAIGVIYRPDAERQSHYFHAWLPQQFDAVIHVDVSRAVRPLEPSADWKAVPEEKGDMPETYPYGL